MNPQKIRPDLPPVHRVPALNVRRTGTDLSAFDRSGYREGPAWKQALWFLASHLFFHTACPWPSALKVWILRLFGGRVGTGVVIKHHVRIKNAWRLEIGDHSWLGEGTWIENLEDVVIGKNVCISQEAMILTGNHDYSRPDFRFRLGKIRLEDGTWIGARSVVCPGITCGSHSVLTVNSVATRDLEAWHVHSGNPSRPVRARKMQNDQEASKTYHHEYEQ